ncbi:MAG TPA: hypothetical protein VM100_08855 [Longimicrobiales bacterium]|nr:hypothetical protein [Longimicrobiales bacterium]
MNFKPWRWGVGVALSASALFVACDGSNLFDADQNPFIEPRVSVALPNEAFAGDSIGVSVSATAAQDLASLSVFIRGAVNKDTTILASGRSVSAVVKFGLPQILTDTLVFVTAVATDKAGNVSKVRGDTMTVVGPPAIISVSQPDSMRAGTTSTFTIRAFGTRRITQLDLTIRGAISKDTTIFISPPRNDVTQSVSLTLPALVNDTSVRVGIVAKDVNGLSSFPVGVTLPLAITGPTAVLQSPVPASVAPGSNLDVTVRATSARSVSKIGIILSGAVSKDTTIDILPPQSDVTRTISIRIPGDATGSTVNVSAYAIDRAGARSVASAQVPVAINNGVPTVTSITTQPADSVRAGAVLDVRVTATGVRPITELNIRFRGATNADQKVTISPAATTVTKDVQIQIPVEVSDTTLTITAVATDQAGQLSPINTLSTRTVRVTDVSAPTVTASPNKSNTAAGGVVQIRIQARDNVALSQVGFAVVNPAGDTIGTTPTLASTRGAVKDTTFSFTVPLTLTPRTVRVLGIAVDASGRRGISPAASLIIADSAAPTITVIAPSAAGTLPLNDSVRVQIRVQDPTGIKEIRLRGESIRVDSLGPTRTVQRFIEKVITFPIAPGVPMPKDTTITRYLNAVPDSISESVNIIVTATDSLSNSSSATTTILVGGPRVELRNPINNAQVVPGGTLLLTAFAVDRSSGIDSVRITISGAQSPAPFIFKSPCAAAICAPNGLASNDSVVINQNYIVGPQLGAMQIQATAWNRNRIAGTSSIVTVTVGNVAITDTAKPQVRVAITANDRVELSDTITLTVAAQDIGQAGLRRVGVVIIANPGGTGVAPDTLYRDSVYVGTGRTGLQPAPFKFTLAQFGYTELNLLRLPRTMTFTVHAFAVDADGNCGANVSNTLLALSCDSIMPPLVPAGQKWFIAKNTPGLSQLVTVVPGFSRALPTAGSTIADLLVDTQRQRMYLANQNFNRVELLNLKDSTFANPISVGSEPWGMFLNNAAVGIGAGAQRLMVANSGGTNISLVDVTKPCGGTGNSCSAVPGAAVSEVGAERILTPNEVLIDVITAVNNGFVRYLTFVHDFSDRPQFIAQDQTGTILHSTKPTGSAPDGTVRYLVATPPGSPRPFESKILFNQNAISQNNDATALAYIDSVIVQRNTSTDDLVSLCDHTPGQPVAGRYCSPFLPLSAPGYTPGAPNDAIDFLRDNNSDVFTAGGAWNVGNVGLSDTTFVTTSQDRRIVGFGEGGTGTFARVWLWQSASQGISDDIAVQDLIGNAAERVLGIALNNDGSIGGARGANSAYFFSNGVNSSGDLRLQGVFSNGIAGGNGGIALHPNHNLATGCNQNTLAFIATVTRTIKIVDTFNFRERGEILIRDNIVGPLRVALPLAAENVGLVGTPDEIAVKLYGVTGAGKAVIINVRTRDIPGVIGGVCQ